MISRKPKGTPAGGQFDANQHNEAGGALGDPAAERLAEAKALNDDLDAIWVERNRAKAAGDTPAGKRDQWDRESAARAALKELASEHGDFDPHTFSTPEPLSYEVFHGLPGEEDYGHEYGYYFRGARATPFGDDPSAELLRDIDEGVAAGSLSPLFDYDVQYSHAHIASGTPALNIAMTLKPGTDQHLYRDVSRARTSSTPVYSDRLRATVSKLRDRAGSYVMATNDGNGNPVDPSIVVSVKTNLRGLGD